MASEPVRSCPRATGGGEDGAIPPDPLEYCSDSLKRPRMAGPPRKSREMTYWPSMFSKASFTLRACSSPARPLARTSLSQFPVIPPEWASKGLSSTSFPLTRPFTLQTTIKDD
ncbi:hypothetical protein FA13DRAFT_1724021 [Coprinellus micaceus]|uniref:Uncharacterized protein n=1 Tax=Coprinellus micaceus TaxID=71717 RepID=A0A4Y7U055_COPMI|nr:hypothetical protein FA13DRAFT_1724021 [Coprinellus micaceus]